jgi:hypothetical protein
MVSIDFVFIILWLIFFIVLYIFQKYKLYSSEKWKISISLFLAVNTLLTSFIFVQQNMIHKEDVVNQVAERYDFLSNQIYNDVLKTIMNKPSLMHLVNEMFLNHGNSISELYDDTKIYDEKFHQSLLHVEEIVGSSKNIEEKALFLQICQSISEYTQNYYVKMQFSEYKGILKRENNRFINIISGFLKYPNFRLVLQYFINFQSVIYPQLYFKEFFNISSTNPVTENQKLVANNKIIDGKINGVTRVE